MPNHAQWPGGEGGLLGPWPGHRSEPGPAGRPAERMTTLANGEKWPVMREPPWEGGSNFLCVRRFGT